MNRKGGRGSRRAPVSIRGPRAGWGADVPNPNRWRRWAGASIVGFVVLSLFVPQLGFGASDHLLNGPGSASTPRGEVGSLPDIARSWSHPLPAANGSNYTWCDPL